MSQRRRIAAISLMFAVLLAAPAVGQHAQYYVLDGFGGVHAAGGAAVISPATPYFGFDVAADIAYVPLGTAAGHGDGILVLDEFGGVHSGGALASAPPVPSPPYFGFRVAKAISYRNVPPRVAGDEFYGSFSVSNSGFLAMNTIAIHAPDDGFLLIMTTSTVGCATTGPAAVLTDLALTVDTTSVTGVPIWRVRIPGSDCVSFQTENMTGTRLVPVSAGSHTVLLMARDAGGGTFGSLKTRTMTALFVDQNELGGS